MIAISRVISGGFIRSLQSKLCLMNQQVTQGYKKVFLYICLYIWFCLHFSFLMFIIQSMDLERSEIDLPFSVRVYEGGFLGLANDTYIHDIDILVHGTFAHADNITIHHNGQVTYCDQLALRLYT